MTEAKKENAIRYRQILDLAPAVIYLKDKQGRYTFVNRRFEVLSGYSEAQVLGRTDFDLFPEAVARNSAENDRQVLETGIPLEIEEFGPVEGRMHTFLSAKFPIYNTKGNIIELCGISTDITARKTAEQSLIESEERFRVALEANPDPVVLCDRNQRIIYSNDQADRSLQQILNCVQSGAELTHQLLGVGRTGKYMPEPLDINENIRNCLALFCRDASGIEINWNLEKGIWEIEADRSQISLVLSSLFANAGRAMPTGGALFIASENVTLSDAHAALYSLQAGRFVKISVSDTGGGLDRETQEHIFDPFYADLSMTTDEALGLSSAYGIVRNHDGLITIDNLAGKGTTFNIFLPARADTDSNRIEKAIPKANQPLTVLLVDDEKLIVQLGSAMLEKMGYEVLVARDGEEALRIFIENKDEVGIVLLDMVMPGMGGLEVFRRLKEIDPDVKILLCSGYSIHGEASRILGQGCDGFIQKPFSIKDLLSKLSEVGGRG